jgi:hypothetical protein
MRTVTSSSSTERATCEPVSSPALPEMTGVASLVSRPAAGAVIATSGASVSILKVRAFDVPVLPAASTCSACTV